jgi:hypothetical protein
VCSQRAVVMTHHIDSCVWEHIHVFWGGPKKALFKEPRCAVLFC